MTDTFKVLAQAGTSLSANTLTTLYTVPASTSTTVSSIVVCNQNSTAVTFRVSIAPAGAANTASQYLYFDVSCTGNNTFIATVGITLATTDVVRIQTSGTTGTVSFNLFGVEIT